MTWHATCIVPQLSSAFLSGAILNESWARVVTETMPRGTVFPPNFATPEALGFQWASEGDLVSKMQAAHGDEATIAAFKAHRDAYLQQADLDKLKSLAGLSISHTFSAAAHT